MLFNGVGGLMNMGLHVAYIHSRIEESCFGDKALIFHELLRYVGPVYILGPLV